MADAYIEDIDRHLPVLDGVRGWAVVLVLVVHACWFYPSHYLSGFDWPAVIFMTIVEYGRFGVDLFFVLSGFLITGLLMKSKQHPNYYSSFYARRSLRIFPLYYLFISIVFFVTPLFVPSFNETFQPNMRLIYYTYLQNFLILPAETLPLLFLGAMWSLAVEEHFYLLWPTVIRHCSGVRLVTLISVLIVAAMFLRCYMMLFSETRKFWAFSGTICRMDALLIGALLAVLLRSEARKTLELWKWKILAIMGLINVVIIAVNVYMHEWSATNTFGYTFHALFFASLINLILFLPRKKLVVKVFDNRLLRLFGKHSYCIYILHGPVMYFLWQYYMSKNVMSFFATIAVFFTLVTGSSLLFSIAIWHLFEKHFLDLKRYFNLKSVEERTVPEAGEVAIPGS